MIYKYNLEEKKAFAYIKFHSWKSKPENNKRFLEQIRILAERVYSQHIYPKIIIDVIDVFYGYEGDDFVKGKMTLRLTFKMVV